MSSTIHHLEMTSREVFCPSGMPDGFELKQVRDAAVNERFYREVGADWQWTERLVWGDEDWKKWVNRSRIETWVALFDDKEAGYFELEQQDEGSVEIVYFGLLRAMIGRRLGGAMLTAAICRAWEMEGTRRVWVHTCTEDHEHALANYEKRGFRKFKTERVFTSPSSPST